MPRDAPAQAEKETLFRILFSAHAGIPVVTTDPPYRVRMNRGRQPEEPSPSEGVDVEERVSAERDLRSALEQHGSVSVILCAIDEVSPAALRAVAASIRSLELNQ